MDAFYFYVILAGLLTIAGLLVSYWDSQHK
jgi:hypothetical protein